MKNSKLKAETLISQIPDVAWRQEFEKSSSKYHITAAWAAIIFDPIFAFTDYINIPENWEYVLVLRLFISIVTFILLMLKRRYQLPSYIIVVIPFVLISLQNAYTYSLIGPEDLLGHTMNYLALFIGTAMFVVWDWHYSVGAVIISSLSTSFFISINPDIDINQFFVSGGLILISTSVFMIMMVRTRYDLTVKEVKARVALQISNEEIKAQNQEIQAQGEEIRGINENLENIVLERTAELETKNKALEEYAFINAHKLRSPVASILGLISLLSRTSNGDERESILGYLKISADKLDQIVNSITRAIERGEKMS